MSAPDWRDMSRADYDTGADLGALFDLTPELVRPDDRHGTGDLLELIP